jgi:U32 family peptidase
MDKEIGRVIHYFDKAMVAVLRLSDALAVGDSVKFSHGENEFTQTVDSMEIEHKKIQSAKKGEEVAIKVEQKTHEGAKVYKVE